jgi:aspartate-semialdehyde dehydrogenase
VVIDNSSAFRYEDDVPLVVSEVNPDAAKQRPRGIIANPNCSTMQLVVALAPIHRQAGIERLNIATYQSVSGTGRRALEELGRRPRACSTSSRPSRRSIRCRSRST